MPIKTIEHAVSDFGSSARAKLKNPAVAGAPEDQLRAPLESFLHDMAAICGFPSTSLSLVGETTLSHLQTRPDYAVTIGKALVGFVEIKAPGKGADPRKFSDPHDKAQWEKLKSLPNLLYTDGNAFSLWRDGELIGKVVHLDGDIESSGTKLAAPATLAPTIDDFFRWNPIPPRSAKKLAEVCARLCRLLRDEVIEQMQHGNAGLTALAHDWRKLLFPQADDTQFADGYAQAVAFGLLVARSRDISLADGIDHAAKELRKSNSLIATALRLLTDEVTNQEALKTSLATLTRVLEEVNWHTISKDKPEAWLYFYEDFLEVYDNKLRKRTGSYYTPPEVVAAMVNLVDEALRGPLFERTAGLAAADVIVADPAVGTGTFLLGVLRRIALTISQDLGPGAVRGAIEAAAKRLIGFELQFGPFAVAQLRIIAEMQALMATPSKASLSIPELRLFVTDTLGNPFIEDENLGQLYEPIAKSRRDANTIKKTRPITVVIGNPPYKEKAEGRGGWIEAGSGGKLAAPLDRWRPPPEWGVSAHTKHLKNLYIYFWRWATWKVFGSGNYAATGFPDKDEEGVVCFITVAGFLNGPGFEKMRDDLRRTCSEIWVVDCSPEGHQPEVATRIFQGVQQPICIVLAARKLTKNTEEPAKTFYVALPKGRREDKFAALTQLSLSDVSWTNCPSDWRAPFLPSATGLWATFPLLDDCFAYSGSGVMPGRTWIIAPDAETLRLRWTYLIQEKDADKKELLFHPHEGGDKTVAKPAKSGLQGHEQRTQSVASDNAPPITPVRYSFRSFDRQWIIPDSRLINRPNPNLWNGYSSQQIFLTALERVSPSSGPALTFTCHIPDLDHYSGRGGRVYPLWQDRSASQANIRSGLLIFLAKIYGKAIRAEDVMAYIAAVMAHPGFVRRFKSDLVQPGLRIPVTADAKIFAESAALGREVIWLHCFGERFVDVSALRAKGPPRLPKGQGPAIPSDGVFPSSSEPLPDTMDYLPEKRRLIVGKGYVDNVTPEMWAYEISGKQVLWQWFSYRRRDRTKPIIGDKRPPSPLDAIQPDGWLPEYTTDLLDLLHVLGRLIALEPKQADLLERICSGPLIAAQEMTTEGALAMADAGGAQPKAKGKD
ncbi:type ISP restriction/modification enzyme [Bradyrhizobium sp. HKCCYLR20261]|uniref:type ISP restriction/modification enzyme n=1 Tax=Bradyrhizobium sp. HKCCYLR20261 TaxID=3420760 RepID=UPI003EB7E865